jgi:hypothetical protein
MEVAITRSLMVKLVDSTYHVLQYCLIPSANETSTFHHFLLCHLDMTSGIQTHSNTNRSTFGARISHFLYRYKLQNSAGESDGQNHRKGVLLPLANTNSMEDGKKPTERRHIEIQRI